MRKFAIFVANIGCSQCIFWWKSLFVWYGCSIYAREKSEKYVNKKSYVPWIYESESSYYNLLIYLSSGSLSRLLGSLKGSTQNLPKNKIYWSRSSKLYYTVNFLEDADKEEQGERNKEEWEERQYNQGQARYDRFEESMMLLSMIYNLELMCGITLVRRFINYCQFFESLIELFNDFQGQKKIQIDPPCWLFQLCQAETILKQIQILVSKPRIHAEENFY